jgi:ssDNA-binding Zn-finger/Zn-ribbon topoisomerase 1
MRIVERDLLCYSRTTMSTTRYQPGVPFCPLCGGPMEARPSLDGSGWVALCPNCPNAPLVPMKAAPQPDPLERDHATARFKKLTQPFAEPQAGAWPSALLEDLPAEARHLLQRRPPSPGVQGTAQLREDMASALRDQGYVLSEDARGLRLSGSPVNRGPGTGRLSVSDVIRMASELGGGAVPAEKRGRCPKCDAVVNLELERCPWCGQVLGQPAS